MSILEDPKTASPVNDLGYLSRRHMLRAMIGGAAIAFGVTITEGLVRPAAAQTTPSDTDILNFALNLEYLEAEFFTMATTGHGITASGVPVDGVGTSGATTGGRQVNFSDPLLRAAAEELAGDEQAHVRLLRTVLGPAAIAKPAIDLNALGLGFSNDAEFLVAWRALEDTGVSAYAGAARFLSNKDYLETAGRILANEAYHMGNARYQIAMKQVVVTALDGKDLLPPPAGGRYFALDSNGLSVIRTTREVLDIVYGAEGAASGGFYPGGMNGAIR